MPATEFVAWYNAHPDFADREFDLDCERVVVIGNGNVAADVARMLALTREELERPTPPTTRSRRSPSSVREVVVLGRRGPAQAAFTNPEVRELGEMADADVVIDPADVELDEPAAAFLDSDAADATNRKNVEIFTEFAEREPRGQATKRIELRFLRSPGRDPGRRQGRGDRGRRQRARTATRPARMRARDTGETEDDRVRAGPALDRLHGASASRASPSTTAAG